MAQIDINKLTSLSTMDKIKSGLLMTGGALVLFLIARKIYKNWKGNANARADENAITSVAQSVAKSKLTITEAEAQVIANNLFNAMKDIGTNEDTIITILSKINGDDFKLIYAKFGTRWYDSFTGQAMSTEPSWYNVGYKTCDLVTMLREELSGDELAYFENKLVEWGLQY